jgi:enamine deaminase RidA (YjgF/YER057c/UK114 family)
MDSIRTGHHGRKSPQQVLRGASALCGGGRIISSNPELTSGKGAGVSFVDLGDSVRLAVMLVPQKGGSFLEQTHEVLATLRETLAKQQTPMTVTLQTVFLRDEADRPECERIFREQLGEEGPLTHFVIQPPCGGEALSLEVWAIGGESVHLERFGPHGLAVSYDSVRWVYCAGVSPSSSSGGVYDQTMDMLLRCRNLLNSAGSDMSQVVRTWFYLGRITELEGDNQRYYELNRARTDFYHDLRFNCSLLDPNAPRGVYPASTGIGTRGLGLGMSCAALQTKRDDVFLLPLENPQQTPAYAYHPRYSPKSPKFSRAMALVLENYVTTWISGTASIVNSESIYPGDVVKQTEQTIDNIENLIAAPNFELHGIKGAGATLQDLAKLRVYVKRPEDYARCKAVCENRFGSIPILYAFADVCRSELLVEIEGIAFSRYHGMKVPKVPTENQRKSAK